MNPAEMAKIAEGNFTRNMVGKGREWTTAARDWAGDLRENVRDSFVKAGYQTETYVRSHPGRFIAGACCMGIAAGFFLGRASRRR